MSKELEKNYNPSEIEERLYQKWLDKKYFHAEVNRDKKPFTIVMPPPKGINKIYNKRNIRKGGRTSVTIVLPITIGNRPQFFHAFSFTVTKAN